jgi:hypothetical protein
MTSTIPVMVSLAPAVFDAMAADDARETTRRRIEREVGVLLADLAVPTRLEVALDLGTGNLRGPLRVTVGGRLCLVPRWVPAEALAYALGDPAVPLELTAQEFVTPPRLAGEPVPPDLLAEALALTVRAAISGRPEVLVSPDDPLAAGLSLGLAVRTDAPDALRLALQVEGELRERRLDELASPPLDLMIEPRYLRTLTTEADGGGLFPSMRDELFVELGVQFPAMHACPDATLRPRGFAFRVNALRTVPLIGLEPDTIFVNDTAERLKQLSVDAVPSANPATHQPGAIVSSRHKEMLEAAGLTTWDALGFYLLALAAMIRDRAHTLVTYQATQDMLADLARAFPDTVSAVATGHVTPPVVLPPLLRALLAEGISVRNLRRILESLHRHDIAPETTGGLDLHAFVRAGLSDLIAAKTTRGARTVFAYLVDPAFERELSESDGIDSPVAEEFRQALHTETGFLPPTSQIPAILTQQRSRTAVRDAIRLEFPHLSVFCYQDLPPDCNVQPIARISR